MKRISKNRGLLLTTLGTALILVSSLVNAANPFAKISPKQWEEAMVISGFDSELLYAIALVESGTSFDGMRDYGPWPWVMNVNREPRFFATRTAAREALQKELDANNDRVAVGMFQIYLRYNAKYANNPIDLIDPVVNLYAGAMVLRDCGQTYDTTESILACYHSGDEDKAGRSYAKRVLRYAEKWGKPFRMQGRNAAVRYSRQTPRANTPVIDLPPVARKNVEMIAAIPKQDLGTSRSLSFMGAIRQKSVSPTHEEFRKRLGAKSQMAVRRVIVVE